MTSQIVASLGVLAALVGYFATLLGPLRRVRKALEGLRAVGEGQKCLLRSQITAIYYRHVDDEDPELREYERKNLDDLCAAYKALGGNSFVTDLYETMRSWRIRN